MQLFCNKGIDVEILPRFSTWIASALPAAIHGVARAVADAEIANNRRDNRRQAFHIKAP
jgi:hypothetical protein